MRRRTALTLLTVAMLVLAGCNNIPSGGSAPPTTAPDSSATTTIGGLDETTTTATTESPDTTQTNDQSDQLAPGLAESGVIDAAELADAHAAVLVNTSYTTDGQRHVWNGSANRSENATSEMASFRVNSTTKVVHDPTRVFWSYDTAGNASVTPAVFPGDIEVWSGENRTFEAVEGPNGTTYRESNGRGVSVASARTGRDSLATLFGALNTTVTETSQNGTTLYRVNSTGVSDRDALASLFAAESVSNVSMTALVDSDGLVHEYHVEYDAATGNRTWQVSQTTRFSALGQTTVERPSWYGEAVNATANQTSR